MARSHTEPLFAAIRAFLAAEFPGESCREVKLALIRGRIVLTVPATASAPAEPPADEAEPSALREAILELLDSTNEPLKSSAIARRLNRKYNGHFRSTIKDMRDDGEITLSADGCYSLAN